MNSRSNLYTRVLGLLTHEYMLYAIAAAMFVGVYYARAAVSIATGALGVIAVLTVLSNEKRIALLKQRETMSLMAVFLLMALSGLVSENTAKWFKVLMINIPYLAIPAGIWAFGPIKKQVIYRLALIFIAVSAVSAILVIANYLENREMYDELYRFGKVIPTPIRHIRYSLFLALAATLGLGVILDRIPQSTVANWTVAVMTLILVVTIHVLAVRTGIVSLYGGILGLVLAMILRERRWVIAGATIAVLVGGAFIAYKTLPSVANKIAYMRYDLKMLQEEGLSPEYSDNMRIISIQHGIEIFKQYPVFGAGIGDLPDLMVERYEKYSPNVPADARYSPISQFVYWLSALGVVGTLVLLILLFYPLALNWKYSYALIALYACMFTSLIPEAGLQLQLGKTLFLVILCLILGYRRSAM